ncbi:GDP-Man:Man(3)GlcNAc(2)-PP-Dol alpha-1,2-mannosyltransferase [Amphibalanus amphitrite]|uniref:GDP-Man:Man(3)GlcNAc(2)-PP-Dol alpha-1,2-mannosyltransferase n=1 Tax=Amphibalanus amphitrite TaxID=1232801 RepID=A0A6A4WEW1_AMPAM|nr:GDP-Man:Man(3)GlcNAc(2)-PP-Dol alpha-1,2-mannosyltransferase [Amphibalanus amphitrite]
MGLLCCIKRELRNSIWLASIILLPTIFVVWLLRKVLRARRPPLEAGAKHVAFFHPYCDDGGGGERVLWTAIAALAERYPGHQISVYTGDTAADAEIFARVQQRFGLRVPDGVRLVRLRSRWLLDPSYYPLLTLLGQAVGSVLVALEALLRLLPDVYIDSMGYGFTLPVFRLLGGCRVGCYVHYPTISSDMLEAVSVGRAAFNNRAQFASVDALRWMKLAYYRLFAQLYGLVGRAAHVVMVNSSWTRAHVVAIWGGEGRVSTVFPPCDLERLQRLPADGPNGRRPPCVLSVGQFRPEKNHSLQLESFSRLLRDHPEETADLRLVLVGGCRGAADQTRVNALKALANALGISERFELRVNVGYDELLELFSEALVGLHTMRDEHFGIGVVEMMAAGVVVVAHCSGGPLTDIVDTTEESRTGYLAASARQYAECMLAVLRADKGYLADLRARARKSCDRFGEKPFSDDFLRACRPLL